MANKTIKKIHFEIEPITSKELEKILYPTKKTNKSKKKTKNGKR